MKSAVTSLALVALLAIGAFADQACVHDIATQLATLNQSSIFLEVLDTWTSSAAGPSAGPTDAASDTVTPCPAIYSPACGADGQTYGNACVAKNQGGGLACEGPCPCETAPAPGPDAACTFIWDPVCSATGAVYGNECTARAAGVDLFCKGECPCKDPLDLLLQDGGYLLVPSDAALEAAAGSGGINADLLSDPALWVSRAALAVSSEKGDSLLALDGAAFSLATSPAGDVTTVDGPSGTAAVLSQAHACSVTILLLDAVPYSLL